MKYCSECKHSCAANAYKIFQYFEDINNYYVCNYSQQITMIHKDDDYCVFWKIIETHIT